MRVEELGFQKYSSPNKKKNWSIKHPSILCSSCTKHTESDRKREKRRTKILGEIRVYEYKAKNLKLRISDKQLNNQRLISQKT